VELGKTARKTPTPPQPKERGAGRSEKMSFPPAGINICHEKKGEEGRRYRGNQEGKADKKRPIRGKILSGSGEVAGQTLHAGRGGDKKRKPDFADRGEKKILASFNAEMGARISN